MDNAEHHHHRTIAELSTARTLREGHRPLLTCYDDVTGARTELSYATLDNWAAKIANLLVQEFAVGPGDTVGLELDGHWTAAAILLACWRIGAAAGPTPRATGATVTCCHERRMREDISGDVLLVGDGLAAEPTTPVAQRPGMLVLADEVHAFADDVDDSDVTPDSPALVLPDATLDHDALLTRAARVHRRIGDRQRIALTGALDQPAGAEVLVATLIGAGSVVATRSDQTAGATTVPWDRLAVEHASMVVGPAAALAAAGPAPASVMTIEV
jgi:uncharacterized protein (TIGR03089 family)